MLLDLPDPALAGVLARLSQTGLREVALCCRALRGLAQEAISQLDLACKSDLQHAAALGTRFAERFRQCSRLRLTVCDDSGVSFQAVSEIIGGHSPAGAHVLPRTIRDLVVEDRLSLDAHSHANWLCNLGSALPQLKSFELIKTKGLISQPELDALCSSAADRLTSLILCQDLADLTVDLQPITSLRRLGALQLHGDFIGAPCGAALAALPQLQHLCVSFGPGLIPSLGLNQGWAARLRSLDMSFCTLQAGDVAAVCGGCRGLTRLCIQGWLPEDALDNQSLLAISRLTALQHLAVDRRGLQPLLPLLPSTLAAWRACSRLAHLYLDTIAALPPTHPAQPDAHAPPPPGLPSVTHLQLSYPQALTETALLQAEGGADNEMVVSDFCSMFPGLLQLRCHAVLRPTGLVALAACSSLQQLWLHVLPQPAAMHVAQAGPPAGDADADAAAAAAAASDAHAAIWAPIGQLRGLRDLQLMVPSRATPAGPKASRGLASLAPQLTALTRLALAGLGCHGEGLEYVAPLAARVLFLELHDHRPWSAEDARCAARMLGVCARLKTLKVAFELLRAPDDDGGGGWWHEREASLALVLKEWVALVPRPCQAQGVVSPSWCGQFLWGRV